MNFVFLAGNASFVMMTEADIRKKHPSFETFADLHLNQEQVFFSVSR